MGLWNTLCVAVAFLLIKLIRVPWRISERALRRQFPVRDHYLIMKMFRLLFHRYPVKITYPNPVANEQRPLTLDLDLCENTQLALFRMKQWYERDWVTAISLAMNSADCFIDVGANVGVFAVTIGQAHPDRQVIAIEPLPSNYSRLEKNVRLNQLSNVRCVGAAVAGDSEQVRIYVNPLNDGGGSLVEFDVYKTGDVLIDTAGYQRKHPDFVPSIDVPAVKLDDMITGKSILKIDVEGAEAQVLESGLNALKSGLIELVVVEVTDTTVRDVVNILEDAGFECLVKDGRSLITGSNHFNGKLGNIVCLKKESPFRDLIMGEIGATA